MSATLGKVADDLVPNPPEPNRPDEIGPTNMMPSRGHALPETWVDLTARRPGVSTSLWSGRAQMRTEHGTVLGPAQVQIQMHPSPRIGYRFACKLHGAEAFAVVNDKGRVFVPPGLDLPPLPNVDARLWCPSSPGRGYTFRTSGDFADRCCYGDGRSVARLIVGVLNFTHEPPGWRRVNEEHATRPYSTFGAGPWRVAIVGRLNNSSHRPWWQPFTGSNAFTHVIEIQRHDGGPFDVGDTADLREALLHILSFAKGSLIGLALPIGYDAHGDAVWIAWETTVSDDLRRPLTWFDSTLFEALGPLINRYVELATDDFWRVVLRRSVRIHLSANTPSPLDAAIPLALTALELLAWAVEQRESVSPVQITSDQVTAADHIRGLFDWVGIRREIPSELVDLAAYATRFPDGDIPATLAGIRNRLVHPPRNNDLLSWPDSPVMTDAWRMAMECVDLCILRLLGHDGSYGHRRHMSGRWLGDVAGVPWTVERAEN